MSTESSRREWLEHHAYLEPMAQLHEALERATSGLPAETLAAACAGSGAQDSAMANRDGIPLLHGAAPPLDRAAAGALLVVLSDRLAGVPLPHALDREARTLADLFLASPELPARAIDWLLDGGDLPLESASPGLVVLLGWTVLRRILAPIIGRFDGSPAYESWHEGHCPTCGAGPILAQLVAVEEGTRRLLVCGLCGTRWAFARIGCPFCASTDPETLDVLEDEDEPRLRLDSCSACQGYVKTYVGEGEEALFLADWASLHLDVLARDRGLRRLGASLFTL